MPLVSYATPEDLAAWLLPDDESTVENAEGLLRAATIIVAKACHISPYSTATGDTSDPLHDATCAQAASWIALGIDPDRAGLTATGSVKRSELFTGKVEYDTRYDGALLERAATQIAQQAADILYLAGLLFIGEFEIADARCDWPEATERPWCP
jgi:hypothetical protein